MRAKALLLATTLLTAATSAPAYAEATSGAAAATSVEEVVVTGFRGKPRTVVSSPAPIDVIGADQLEATGGAAPLRDVLTQLIPSFQAQTVGSSSWDSLARPAGLRGLGGVHVLVLVDGKRRHNSSLINLSTGNLSNGGNPVDLDLIPSSAIERIEVLRDGAAAQYGSDAIAGVINVILRSDKDGGRLNVNAGQRYAYHGVSDGETMQADIYHGFSIGDGGSLTLAMDAKTQHDALRGVAASGAFYFPLAGGVPDPRETTASRLVYRGGLPKNKSVDLSFNGELPKGDLQVYSSGTLSFRDAVVGQAFRRPNSNQDILAIYPNGFSPNYTLREVDYQAIGGVKSEAGPWHWDLSTTYGRNHVDNGSSNTLNASLGPTSPTSFHTFSSAFDQWTTDFDITSAAHLTATMPLQISAGLEYRWERYVTKSGDPLSFAAGNFVYPAGYGNLAGKPAAVGAQGAITVTPADAADISRSNYAAYVDLGLDVTDHWYVAGAARFEHYDDSAGDVLGGKLSTRYEISPAVALRATISNGFRAPSLSQEGFAQTSNQANIINGQFVFIQSNTVRPESAVGQALGAKPLHPEKSTNYSIGVALTPISNLAVTLDAYRIDLNDRIALTGQLTGAGVSAILTKNGIDPNRSVRYFANAIDTETTGLDLVATYRHDLGDYGTLRTTLGFNWNKTRISHIASNPTQLAGLGLTLFDRQSQGGVTLATPRTKLLLGGEWTRDRLHVNLHQNLYGDFYNLNNVPANDQHYGAKWITDLEAAYDISSSVTAAVGANNLFNVYPDKNTVPDTTGFAPYGGNSPFGLYGGYYYARVSVKF